MKRLSFMVLVLALVVMIPMSNTFAAQVFKIATGDPENSEQGVAAKAFKQYLDEKAKGKFDVQLFFSGTLGDETETIHNVRAGTLDASVVGIANLVPFAKGLGILTLPYLFDNLEQVVAATEGKGSDYMNALAVKAGFRVLTWTYTDFRYISNSKRPIKKMADMKGLKFRVPQSAVLLASYKAFGGSPVPISWSETFTSMQQGVVDGQCYGHIGFLASKFNEANQKYITEVHYTYQLQPLIISEVVFEKLSKEDQKLVVEAGKFAQKAVYDYLIAETVKAKETLKKLGIEVIQLEDEAEWKKVALAKVWPEMADFVGGKKAINEYLKAIGKPEWK